MQTTIGSNRIGSGKKMQVSFDGYQRSTFNGDKIVRTTASVGTIIPVYVNVALPEDTWDIGMEMEVYTNPTVGPLFGSLEGSIHWFEAAIRLYNSFLHNNKLRIGNNISRVKFPQIELTARPIDYDTVQDLDNAQINPSSIMAYLGVRGIGIVSTATERSFNAIPLLMLWDVYKQYYANLQENIGAVVHYGDITPSVQTITNVTAFATGGASQVVTEAPATSLGYVPLPAGSFVAVTYAGAAPDPKQVMLNLMDGRTISFFDLAGGAITPSTPTTLRGYINTSRWGSGIQITNWNYSTNTQPQTVAPNIATFDLENIDLMREEILAFAQDSLPYVVNSFGLPPYNWIHEAPNGIPNLLMAQEGLPIRTYKNDIMNNWLETASVTYINNASAVTISGGKFTMDQLNFSQKMYDYLNRTMVAGGSFFDWIEAAYDSMVMRRSEMPAFKGGMVKNIIFQEVISSVGNNTQPLATLGGIGRTARDKKGGHIVIKTTEPSYLMALLSFVPRIDYSQGNKWHVLLENMENLFKPAFNQIGFQEDINEIRAWWTTNYNGADWVQTSAGFLPAWINYQTDYNETYGNFAYGMSQSFMTLNRSFQWQESGGAVTIQDLTTYIDPVRYNQVFAQTSLDSQNIWAQIGFDIKIRRKMSAKIMPKV